MAGEQMRHGRLLLLLKMKMGTQRGSEPRQAQNAAVKSWRCGNIDRTSNDRDKICALDRADRKGTVGGWEGWERREGMAGKGGKEWLRV